MGLPAHRLLVGWGCVKLVSEQGLRKLVLLSPVVFLYTILHYWQPHIFKFKVHTYQVFQSTKSTMSDKGYRGRPRRAIPEAFDRTVVPYLRKMST